MPFVPRRQPAFQELKTAVINNSQTIAIGDAIVPGATTHGAAVVGASGTTGSILGVVLSIVGTNGRVLEVSSYAAAANNETVAMVSVQYVPSYIPMDYTATLSQAGNTTANSNLVGYFNMSGSVNGTLDETSYAAFGTQKQFFSYGNVDQSTTLVAGHWSKTL